VVDPSASPAGRADASAPLHGVRVLDLTRLFPFAYATQFLVDLGADVVKVEEPGGEVGRSYAAQFAATNRGKSSEQVALRTRAGRARLLELVDTADVLVESFRPGFLASLGLGYESLRDRRPELVMCSVSGYAADGPSAHRPGHDLNYLLLAGGGQVDPGLRPVVPVLPVVDVAVASHLCAAVTAALYRASRGGGGCHVEIPMADLALSISTSNHAFASQLAHERAVPYPEFVLGDVPAYRVWGTADGRWVALCNLEPKFAVGERGAAVVRELEPLLAARSAAQWAEVFAEAEVCFSPVLTPDEAFEHPEYAGRGLVRCLDGVPEVLYPGTFDGRRPVRSSELPELSVWQCHPVQVVTPSH
jgi:alpha-methylacyl-CoA racemase